MFKGYKHTIEARNKISKNNARYWLGKKREPVSDQTRRKISDANKGEKKPIRSSEHRRKLSEAHKGNKYAWRGGKIQHSGYILIYQSNHPFCNLQGYIREHRLVVEKCLGRYLTKLEIIHHINGIKDDNRPENLYLFNSESEHQLFEQSKNKPKLISNLTSVRIKSHKFDQHQENYLEFQKEK